MESCYKTIHRDMIRTQYDSDKYIDSKHWFAVNIDIESIDTTFTKLEKVAVQLFMDTPRQPASIYACLDTLVLFFPPLDTLDTMEEMFNGSHHRLISWFISRVYTLFKISPADIIVTVSISDFKSSFAIAEYFTWACQLHQRAYMAALVRQIDGYKTKQINDPDHPDLLTMHEMNQLIATHDIQCDPIIRHGCIYKIGRSETSEMVINRRVGPFKGTDIELFRDYLFGS